MDKKIIFPKEFLWGGAVSAEQTEGHGITPKAETVFDRQYKEDPQDFHNDISPAITSDFMNKYKEDVELWSELGINSHRTSFSWARIFPTGDYSKPNKKAIKWYHDFIDEMLKYNITPMFTLYHFDMPMYAMEKGGWESRDVWYDFLEYSKFVLKEFAGKVKIWTTMNEPWVPMEMSYLLDVQYPKLNSDQAGVNAAYGIVMSHALVVNYFNESIKDKYNAKIGAIFNSSIVYPRDKNNPDDVKAAEYADLFQFSGLTDPMVMGKWNPKIIKWVKDMDLVPTCYKEGDFDILSKVTVDLVGLNYYKPIRAKAPTSKNNSRKYKNYFEYYDMPGKRENKFRGWEIYPEALYDTMKIMYEKYGSDKEYMLTEYGMGVENEGRFRNPVGLINDEYRIVFIKEHLYFLNKLMQDTDIKVVGAHMWATFDCWSWGNAYKNRYGLIEVDLKTQERKPKISALFLKNVTQMNGFEYSGEKTEDYIDFNKK